MLYGAAMNEFPRYAIYYAPDADSALARFGAETLGYDPFTGNDVLVPGDLIMQAPDWPAVIKDPRKCWPQSAWYRTATCHSRKPAH